MSTAKPRKKGEPVRADAKANAKASDRTSAATNRELLYSMLLQRRFEERVAEMYAIGRIGGFCHLYIGQEAISTGVMSLLRADDYIITTYRDHGQALARGMTPRAAMAELFGRQDGCAKGKGGDGPGYSSRLLWARYNGRATHWRVYGYHASPYTRGCNGACCRCANVPNKAGRKDAG